MYRVMHFSFWTWHALWCFSLLQTEHVNGSIEAAIFSNRRMNIHFISKKKNRGNFPCLFSTVLHPSLQVSLLALITELASYCQTACCKAVRVTLVLPFEHLLSLLLATLTIKLSVWSGERAVDGIMTLKGFSAHQLLLSIGTWCLLFLLSSVLRLWW